MTTPSLTRISLQQMPRWRPPCLQASIIGHGQRRRAAHGEQRDWIWVRRGLCRRCGKKLHHPAGLIAALQPLLSARRPPAPGEVQRDLLACPIDTMPLVNCVANGQRIPLPYLSCAIIADAVSLYFSGPTPSGSSAVNTCPQALQRSLSSS